MTYHDMEEKSTLTSNNFEEVKWIKEIILKDILALSAVIEEGPKNVNMFDLDARENEVKFVPDGKFEAI